MNESIKNRSRIARYEYNDVAVSQSMESLYVDGYRNFGWELEDSSFPLGSVFSIKLKFKRDRRYREKAELTRLQRQFDSCVNEIETMESSKGLSASVIAYMIGIIGTACIAGSAFAFLAGNFLLMAVLAIPAVVGFTIPYFCYTTVRKRKTLQLDPIIDKKYDEIYTVCEKANHLLAE